MSPLPSPVPSTSHIPSPLSCSLTPAVCVLSAHLGTPATLSLLPAWTCSLSQCRGGLPSHLSVVPTATPPAPRREPPWGITALSISTATMWRTRTSRWRTRIKLFTTTARKSRQLIQVSVTFTGLAPLPFLKGNGFSLIVTSLLYLPHAVCAALRPKTCMTDRRPLGKRPYWESGGTAGAPLGPLHLHSKDFEACASAEITE